MRSAPRALAVALAFATVALAGCLGADPLDPSGAAGLLDPPLPGLPAFGLPAAVSREWPGAEPVLARAPDGTLYLEGIGRATSPPALLSQNANKVFRSDDAGATWVDITPPGPGEQPTNDGYVAVAEDGTVYAANVWALTYQVFRSDDRGATWLPLNVPRMPLLMHRHWIIPTGTDTVHMAIEALPPSFATYLVGVQPPAAQTGNPNEGMWYTRSDDRGVTWSAPVQVDAVVNFAGQTNLVASADGQALYVGRYEEPGRDPVAYTYGEDGVGQWYLLASEDAGASWQRRDAFPLTSELSTAVPGLALDPEGRLSMVWSQELDGSSRVHLATSRDGGRTWDAPVALALPSPGTHAMAWAAARSDGTLGVLWYGADVDGRAQQVDAPWHVDYAELTWSAQEPGAPPSVNGPVRVTPEPVHEGNICAKGPACGPGEDRRLLDYPWMVFDDQGHAHLAFASTMWEKPSAFAVYAGPLGQPVQRGTP